VIFYIYRQQERKELIKLANINDIVCTAAEIVANNKIEKLSYDKTIVATILNNSEANSGRYYVSDGSVSFYAYSTNTSLRVND
jgi:hypothetical protein